MNVPQSPPGYPDVPSRFSPLDPPWSDLVDKLRSGEPSGMEDLYRIFHKGIRFQLFRRLGPQDVDDRVHDIFLTITQSIRKGELREPDRLTGYVRTIVRRQIAMLINGAIQTRRTYTDLDSLGALSDRRPNPEHSAIAQEHFELAARILQSLSRRDRDVLIRFYLREQSSGQICCEMKLTETQFRLIKSRAKARFGELGRTRLAARLKL
jgi:RNA polymerase sigma factor (sigma-70 family)